MRRFQVIRLTMVAVLMMVVFSVPAQTGMTLPQRYEQMKATSQTYNEYKVIKQVILDAEWKIMMDSLKSDRAKWATTRADVARLEQEVKKNQDALKEKEASVADIEYASTHIAFMGISFAKATFIVAVVVIVGLLVVLIGLIIARMKITTFDLKDRTEAFNALHTELEEYKKQALAKQTKLSRELQNERNRMMESRK